MSRNTFILWLLTITFWGISPIIEKAGLKHVEPLPALFIRTFSALIFIFIVLLFSSPFSFSNFSFKDISIISLSGIVGGFLGMFTYFVLLKSQNASQIVPLTSTYPLIATILAIVILKEKLTLNKFLGTLFVVIGVYLLFKSSN